MNPVTESDIKRLIKRMREEGGEPKVVLISLDQKSRFTGVEICGLPIVVNFEIPSGRCYIQ